MAFSAKRSDSLRFESSSSRSRRPLFSSDGLANADALAEGDDGGLDEDVGDEGDDEVVGGGAVLDVEEAPLVDDGGVGEEDVGGVLVGEDGLLGDADDLEGGPDEGEEGAEEEDDGEDDEGGRVGLDELPQAQHGDLREADEAEAEQDALERRLPVAAELEEAVALGPVVLGGDLGAVPEGGDAEDGEEHKGAVDDEAGQEQVGRLDPGLEGHALDAVDYVRAVLELDVGAAGDGAEAALDGADRVQQLDGALRDLDRHAADRVEQAGGLAAGGALVPGAQLLHPAQAHDAHGPLEVLRPGLDDGGHVDAAEAEEGLGLEVAEQGEGVGGEVGGGVGVAHGGDDAGGAEAEAGDDGGGPFHADEVDRLAVGEVGLDAGDGLVRVGEVDEGADGGVEVGDGVGDARDGVELVADLKGELHVDLARLHGAEALEVGGARVDGLAQVLEAVDAEGDVEDGLALDGDDGGDVGRDGAIVGRDNDVEEAGGEVGILLAVVERGRLEDAVGEGGGEEGGEGGVDEVGNDCGEFHFGEGSWEAGRWSCRRRFGFQESGFTARRGVPRQQKEAQTTPRPELLDSR
ncbi:hypothetical protein ColTof3_03225 [Colletotrichum tofieldiae]|nr:hypothetical protein ColTof3_03225 [Colletotrichum tofieldiae]